MCVACLCESGVTRVGRQLQASLQKDVKRLQQVRTELQTFRTPAGFASKMAGSLQLAGVRLIAWYEQQVVRWCLHWRAQQLCQKMPLPVLIPPHQARMHRQQRCAIIVGSVDQACCDRVWLVGTEKRSLWMRALRQVLAATSSRFSPPAVCQSKLGQERIFWSLEWSRPRQQLTYVNLEYSPIGGAAADSSTQS